MANNTEITNGTTNAKTLAPIKDKDVWFVLSLEMPNIASIQSDRYLDHATALNAFDKAVEDNANNGGMVITLTHCVGIERDQYTATVIRHAEIKVYEITFTMKTTNKGLFLDAMGDLKGVYRTYYNHDSVESIELVGDEPNGN